MLDVYRLKVLLLALICGFPFVARALATDCSKIPPFSKVENQSVAISATKLFWVEGELKEQEICESVIRINAFDVRGREDEAFKCLIPSNAEVLSCKTTLQSEAADLYIVPASWIRTWSDGDRREFRFHAYLVKKNSPDDFLDLFSRILSKDLSQQDLLLEGALKASPSIDADSFFIRTHFIR